jgi:signal transduction histidine kinase
VIAIRRELLRRLLVGLFFVLGACGFGVYFLLRDLLVSEYDGSLEAKARVLTALIEEKHNGFRLEEEANLPEFEPGPAPEYFSVWVDGGERIATSASLGDRDLPALLPQGATPVFTDLALPDGRRGRMVTLRAPAPVEHGDRAWAARPPRYVRFLVARERGSLDAKVARVSSILAIAGALLFLGVPLVVRSVVRRGLQPLDRLADQAERIDASLLDTRFPTSDLPEELLPICSRLNDLLERLTASFERERRFSADVAHELRTPLAELRATAEVALRYPDVSATPALEDVLGATVQMERLVNTLFTLSRCESGRQPVALERLELGAFVRDAWAGAAPAALAKRLVVAPPAPTALTVMADRALLGAIVANLFSNAIEYAPAGGELTWAISTDQVTATLAVTNTNSVLAPEDVAHVFEPFWRRDPARSGGTHSGLGLSLSQAFARLQGGDVELELTRPDQVRVSLRLTVAEAGASDVRPVIAASPDDGVAARASARNA